MTGSADRPVSCRIVSAGVSCCAGDSGGELLEALRARRGTFREPAHCDGGGRRLGVIPELDGCAGARGKNLLARLRRNWRFPELPDSVGCPLFFATTVGNIDLLEQADDPDPAPDTAAALLRDAQTLFGSCEALLCCAACSSGTRALILAAWRVISGQSPAALALGCDVVSTFVTAGFGALGALSATAARPYAADRDGLTLGEAAAGVLVMRDDLADELGLPDLGQVLRWGASCDATHITAPDSGALPLERAIRQALGGEDPAYLAGIVGHGTGTVYNDAAEVTALRRVFPEERLAPPLFSVKGVTGHTLGATGLVQVVAGLSALAAGEWPGAGDCLPDHAVMAEAVPFARTRALERGERDFLSVTIGFGGINECILIRGRAR